MAKKRKSSARATGEGSGGTAKRRAKAPAARKTRPAKGPAAKKARRATATTPKKKTRRTSRKASSIAGLPHWTSLDDEWLVDDRGFDSPRKAASQSLLFNEPLKDATISAEITLGESLGDRWQGLEAREANLVFRYAGHDQYYYAGIGAWGTKFHISKALPGPGWLRLASVGSAETLEEGRTYRFRVECQGPKILLFENDTKVLEAYDDDYGRGRWGLFTWKTRARYEALAREKSPLQCFVAMPFAAELDGVYDLIERVVESYEDIECTRADQLAVSRPIMDDVRDQIARADLVIVDLTGRNSNVYYEAGMAAAWKKDWVVLAQSHEDLTFDVEQIRSILYTNRMGGEVDLEARLRQAIEDTLGLARKEAS